MTIKEKRNVLKAYCNTRICAEGECKLHIDAFKCGRGKWFDGEGAMPDNDIEKAYKLVFGEDKPTIKDSGDRTIFSTGAVRDYHPEEKGRMDLLPWNAIGEVSVHCARGAAKYSEHNVDLGIPAHSLADSGLRHMRKFLCGETDEDHLLAAVWNFMWLLEMRTTHPELMDIPWRPKDD